MDNETNAFGSGQPLTLAIDIGGTRLKAGILDTAGNMVAGPNRVDTPHPSPPAAVMDALVGIIRPLGSFDRISVGFPGVVRKGFVLKAPNLGNEDWNRFPLVSSLIDEFHKPTRLLNDAEVQGLGVIQGRGLECVITLGTGFGFAVFDEGKPAPHLELSHHPLHKGKTYDQFVGVVAFKEVGRKRWNKRVKRALTAVEILVGYDVLYIGGGNAKHIDLKLADNVHIVSNEAGITGGVKLWDQSLDAMFTHVM